MATETTKRRRPDQQSKVSNQKTRRVQRVRARRKRFIASLCAACIVLTMALVSLLGRCNNSARQEAPSPPPSTSHVLEACVQLPLGVGSTLLSTHTASEALMAAETVQSLSVEQKVAQLFIVTPEALIGPTDDPVTAAGDLTREALIKRPVGGIVYFKQNLVNAEQTSQMLENTKRLALEACGIPILLDVDEEGGTVSRIGGNEGFDIENVGNMSAVGETEDTVYAGDVARTIGSYLHDLGFTADFAPVADIANNPDSDTMHWRSFGSDAALVSSMVAAQVEGFASQGIICAAKHFPGIGSAEGDSHDGSIYTYRSLEDMLSCELVPFASAIEAEVPMVMVGHLSCPTITGNDLPATVSPAIMQDVLRDTLGFEGVIVTDSLGMGAIVELYGNDRVAVEAFKAGADALLMPADFDAAYRGMLEAVASGEISQQRLDESVYRIVRMKMHG